VLVASRLGGEIRLVADGAGRAQGPVERVVDTIADVRMQLLRAEVIVDLNPAARRGCVERKAR